MPYTLRKPVGPVERQLLERAREKLAEFPDLRHVRFLLPPTETSTKPLSHRIPTNDDGPPIYTVDRSPVGEIGGTPILVITIGTKPALLFSPYYQKVAESRE